MSFFGNPLDAKNTFGSAWDSQIPYILASNWFCEVNQSLKKRFRITAMWHITICSHWEYFKRVMSSHFSSQKSRQFILWGPEKLSIPLNIAFKLIFRLNTSPKNKLEAVPTWHILVFISASRVERGSDGRVSFFENPLNGKSTFGGALDGQIPYIFASNWFCEYIKAVKSDSE